VSYLLDTHVWLWMLTAPDRLGVAATQIMSDSTSRLLLSAASTWEIAIKYAAGRLNLPQPPGDYLLEWMRRSNVQGLAISHTHALAVASLRPHHRDPFDRMIAAQAKVESVPLITADRVFAAYDVELIAAGEATPA